MRPHRIVIPLLGILALCSLALPAEEKHECSILFYMGDVAVKIAPDTSWKIAEIGMSLPDGSMILTGEDSRAELVLKDGSRMNVDAASLFEVKKIDSKKEDFRFKVHAGSVISNIKKLSGGRAGFKIETPTAVAAIRGTGVGLHTPSLDFGAIGTGIGAGAVGGGGASGAGAGAVLGGGLTGTGAGAAAGAGGGAGAGAGIGTGGGAGAGAGAGGAAAAGAAAAGAAGIGAAAGLGFAAIAGIVGAHVAVVGIIAVPISVSEGTVEFTLTSGGQSFTVEKGKKLAMNNGSLEMTDMSQEEKDEMNKLMPPTGMPGITINVFSFLEYPEDLRSKLTWEFGHGSLPVKTVFDPQSGNLRLEATGDMTGSVAGEINVKVTTESGVTVEKKVKISIEK